MRILVTGGAGFIGSALVRQLVRKSEHEVLNFDKLTYAATLAAVAPVSDDPRYRFVQGDIGDGSAVRATLNEFKPHVIVHLAAETHVDRSIDGSRAFIDTNIVGTYTLLEAALRYWKGLTGEDRDRFLFHHVSTDEVFGSLGETGFFTEETAYDPRSPYSASKAASDFLVRSWSHTYGLPAVLTNCSNNYGPYQFPEKLIPLTIVKALGDEPLPVYGRGENIRDWLFVEDHARALQRVFEQGKAGQTYNVGGGAERRNIDVVEAIAAILDRARPRPDGRSYREQIAFVEDRPGHDLRYAIDCSKIRRELGWRPHETFDSGLQRTIHWYLENAAWWQDIQRRGYAGERLGLAS